MKRKDPPSTQHGAEYIAGIGASAGGLEALQEFFKAVPLKTGIGFVVIQHLSPDYKSLMDELLARYTRLPIKKAEDGMLVEPDTVYLIPARKNLSIFHGKLMLEDQGARNGIILPIDIFFRSLAKDLEKRAIGIILSGTGSDGTLGTRAIKEAGGMVMAQDERTAKFDGMPRSSISTGLVDYILPPSEMPEALHQFIKHPFVDKAASTEAILSGDEDGLSKILMTLREFSGIDFSYYKENTILRRLERRLSINRFERLEDYYNLLTNSEKEKDTLYRELLIGVTRFFRDEAAFEVIVNKVLPKLLDNGQKEIRIWSAGCSTGEEVYSLAMLIRSYLDDNRISTEVKIFATDIDRRSLEYAGQGLYPESIVSDVDPKLLARYFVRKENGYQIGESIRKMAIFASHNVLKDPPFSKLDLIVCRNLFIYFKPDSQLFVLNLFRLALKPGGFLFMGSSETLGVYTEAFDVVHSKHKIYQKRAGYSNSLSTELPGSFVFRKNESLSDSMAAGKRFQKKDFIADLILERLVPPSVIFDDKFNILQVVNDINPFVELKAGRFNQSLNGILSADLMVIVNNLIRRLKAKKEVIAFEGVKLVKAEKVYKVNIEGRMLQDDGSTQIYIVSFYDLEDLNILPESKEVVKMEARIQDQISELQYELQFTKESLQATVEELETSNEELQASNEELIASNEELQSTNEELQSVNEELYTVNSEYQNKIEELTQLNNDVNNLLNNTGIAALYLDSKMCIRKFTSSFASISKLMDYDVGRPVRELATAFVYPGFLTDINLVQENLQAIEKEVMSASGELFLLRIVPYRTDFQAVDGILVTMVNIQNLHLERTKLVTANQRLQGALEMGNMAWWEWDINTGIVNAHEKKARMIGYSPEEFPKNVYKICELIHPDDYERTMENMRDHLSGKSPNYDVQYRIKSKSGAYHWYWDKGGIIERDQQGKPMKLVGLVIDISQSKALENS